MLDDLLQASIQAADFPIHSDTQCVLCFKEGDSMVDPIRVEACRAEHYMCLACWTTFSKKRVAKKFVGKCFICDPLTH